MNKLITALVAMGIMSVSTFALDGKIGKVNFTPTGVVWVDVVDGNNVTTTKQLIAATADIKKVLIAAVLTAKSTSAEVTVWPGTLDGVTGWKNIILK
jgi:hypothetical protein